MNKKWQKTFSTFNNFWVMKNRGRYWTMSSKSTFSLCMIQFFTYACYIWFILRYFWGLLLWTKEVFILIDQDEKVPPIVCAIFFCSHLNDLVVSCYWAVYWCNCRVVELRHVCLRYKNKASQDIEKRKNSIECGFSILRLALN